MNPTQAQRRVRQRALWQHALLGPEPERHQALRDFALEFFFEVFKVWDRRPPKDDPTELMFVLEARSSGQRCLAECRREAVTGADRLVKVVGELVLAGVDRGYLLTTGVFQDAALPAGHALAPLRDVVLLDRPRIDTFFATERSVVEFLASAPVCGHHADPSAEV